MLEKKRDNVELEEKENGVIDRSNSSKLFRRQMLMITLSVIVVVAISLAGSYAIFSKTSYGNEYNLVYVGDLNFSYVDLSDDGNILSLASSYPISDSDALDASPYRFSVENTGTIIANYTIKIVKDEAAIIEDGCRDNLLDLSYVRYKFDNDTEADLLTIASSTNNNEYIVYEGTLQAYESNIHEIRVWLNEASPNSVLGKHFHGKVVVEVEQNNATDPYERPINPAVSNILFASENLGANCTTYNDGVDTFLVGQCSNNYIWYSGKLWRVVLKNNETGAVKMVTDNAITVISYSAEGNTAFENSYMDQWLNQEFLPTLHDYSDYLVTNSIWDATLDDNEELERPGGTTTVERTVGLLNAYEYYTTSAASGYLHNKASDTNGEYWWLITPYNAYRVWNVYYDGTLSNSNSVVGNGVRPSVNLKSGVQIDSGSGSQSNPYILKGDKQETVVGTTLLSTRYSGEYVTFNNGLYRIVAVENGLTKITAVNKPSSLARNKFHSASGVTSFADATIKTDLETYYQGLKTTNETAFNMIEPNTTWYLGGVGSGDSFGNYHYKASICASVDASVSMNACTEKATSTTASIALPRVGEMFTSQITRGTKASFWTLTPYSASEVRYVPKDGTLNISVPSNGYYGARPSMYLKSGVVIASNNTGNGTYEYPYQIQ